MRMSIGHQSGKFVQRCPKLLSKQAGDRFALEILKNSVKPITDGLNQDFNDPEDWKYYIELLLTIKRWYWEEASEWLGYGCSKLRYTISKSIMDLLDVRKRFRKSSVLQRYIIQMLFCCEVGNFERPQEMVVGSKDCGTVTKFIKALGPFYFEKLYDTYLKFDCSRVLDALLRQSPELKMIHLRHSISPRRFLPLNHCRNLQVVTIDIENTYNESFDTLSHSLHKTFFGNEGRGLMDFKYLPFPHMKAVCIRSDRFPEQLLDILFLLQKCPNMITQQTCLISLPFNTVQKVSPFVCPTMLVVKDADHKSVQVYLRTPFSASCVSGLENSMESENNLIKFSQKFTLGVHNLQNAIGRIQFSESLRYVYFDKDMAVISTADRVIGEDLAELHVFGKLSDYAEVQKLVKVLNSCPRLKVLCLQLEISIDPSMKLLNLMNHLRILSVSLKWFSQPTKSHSMVNMPPDRNSISFILSLIRAAPNIDVLEIPGRFNLLSELQQDLISNVETLILIDADVDEGKYFVRNLPSLSVLMMSTDSDKKYKKIKKAFRATQLEVLSKNTIAVFPPIM